jgi:pimeloyl-ACP methyl ester carboxylesterase
VRAIVDPPADAAQGDDVLASLMCPADLAFVETPTGQQVEGTMAEGLAAGAQGWLDDDTSFVSPWPFDVGRIEVPTLVTHGDEDRFAPVSHAHWLGAHVAGSALVVRPGEGHLSMYGLVSDVHAWLLDH